jgi:hypothetical protein
MRFGDEGKGSTLPPRGADLAFMPRRPIFLSQAGSKPHYRIAPDLGQDLIPEATIGREDDADASCHDACEAVPPTRDAMRTRTNASTGSCGDQVDGCMRVQRDHCPRASAVLSGHSATNSQKERGDGDETRTPC